MKVQIDNREPPTFIKYMTKKLEADGHEVEVCQLEVGDIVIPDKGICIERKQVPDFYGSLISRRLEKQIENMRQYPTYCVIIVGQMTSLTFKMSKHMKEPVFFGGYRSVVLRHKCPVISVSNNLQFWLTLKSIIVHCDDISQPIDAQRIRSTLKDSKLAMLCCVPGIGPVRARRILKKYQTLANIIQALEEDNFVVTGISSTRLKRLSKCFFERYDET